MVGAADHRGDDRAVSHLVLTNRKGVQGPPDEHRIGIQLCGRDKAHTGVELTFGDVVVERINEGGVVEVVLVRIEPGKKHIPVDCGGLGEDASLSRTQRTVDIGLVTLSVIQGLGRGRRADGVIRLLYDTC